MPLKKKLIKLLDELKRNDNSIDIAKQFLEKDFSLEEKKVLAYIELSQNQIKNTINALEVFLYHI